MLTQTCRARSSARQSLTTMAQSWSSERRNDDHRVASLRLAPPERRARLVGRERSSPVVGHATGDEGHRAVGDAQPPGQIVRREDRRLTCCRSLAQDSLPAARHLARPARYPARPAAAGSARAAGRAPGPAVAPARARGHARGLSPSCRRPTRSSRALTSRLAMLNAVHAREEVQVLLGCQLLVEHWLVAEITDAPPDVLRVAAEVETINRDLASAGTRERRQDAQQRGLARAVGAEQRHRRASGNRQRDAAQDRLELERLAHIARDHGMCHLQAACRYFRASRGRGRVSCAPSAQRVLRLPVGARSHHAHLLAALVSATFVVVVAGAFAVSV